MMVSYELDIMEWSSLWFVSKYKDDIKMIYEKMSLEYLCWVV